MRSGWQSTYRGQLYKTISEESRKETPMSQVLWCDKGGHAFSAKDLNRQHFSQTQTVKVPTGNSYGKTTYQERHEVTEEIDMCGACWAKTDPFNGSQNTIEAAEEDSYKAEVEMWKNRYEAELERSKKWENRPWGPGKLHSASDEQ
jgi:hypothetical protein